jgi:hypothetical protein
VLFPTLISQIPAGEKLSVAPPANFTIKQQWTATHVQLGNTTTWPTWPTNSHSPVKLVHATHLHPSKVFLTALIAIQINTAMHRQNHVQRAQVGTKCWTKQQVLWQSVPNANPVNSKINPGLKRAKIVLLVITKARTASRIALAAFLASTKTKKAQLRVKSAPKTRQQPIANVPHHVTLAVWAGRRQTEVWHVRNVWPGNLKKRQARTKRSVPFVHRATTRTRLTCQRASGAHVGMLNRRPGKRRAFRVSKENTTMWKARQVASFAT